MTTKNALRVRRFRMRKREYSDTLRTWTPKLSVTEEVRDGKTGLYISWEFSHKNIVPWRTMPLPRASTRLWSLTTWPPKLWPDTGRS